MTLRFVTWKALNDNIFHFVGQIVDSAKIVTTSDTELLADHAIEQGNKYTDSQIAETNNRIADLEKALENATNMLNMYKADCEEKVEMVRFSIMGWRLTNI